MKILYIDIFAESINPTAALTPLLFRTVTPNTIFYGPGLVSRTILENGLRRFIDRAGPFDVAVFGPNIPILSDDENAAVAATEYLSRFAALAPDPMLILTFLNDVLHEATDIPIRTKILSTLNFDYYACSNAQIERIHAGSFHIVGPNRQAVCKLAELPNYAREERHFRRKSKRLCDAYAEFVSQYPERIVTAFHFVAETEFTFRHSEARRYKINIPGVEYVLRRRARKAIANSEFMLAPKRVFNLYRLLGKLGVEPFARYVPLNLYHAAFREGLIDSQLVYTARGGFGIPIRKFFEIPAAGALMICTPPHGFGALGFHDGEHYIEADPEALPNVVTALSHDAERVSRIAQQGQALVFDQHSLAARAHQIRSCLEALVDGTYRGADWVGGKLVLRSGNDQPVAREPSAKRALAVENGA